MASFPQEIIDFIIDYLHDSKTALSACSLVSLSWLPSSRFHLFHTLNLRQTDCHFNSAFDAKTFNALLEQSDQCDITSITPYIRDVRLYADALHDQVQYFTLGFGTIFSILSKLPHLHNLRLEGASFYSDTQSTALIHPQMKRFQLRRVVLLDFDVIAGAEREDSPTESVNIPSFQLISALFSDIGQCTIAFSQDPLPLSNERHSLVPWNDGRSIVDPRLTVTHIGHLNYDNHSSLWLRSRHDHFLEKIQEYLVPTAVKCIELSLGRAVESSVAAPILGGLLGEHIQKLIIWQLPAYWEESSVKHHFDLRSCTALQDLTLRITFRVDYQGPDRAPLLAPTPLLALLHHSHCAPNLRTLTIIMSLLPYDLMRSLEAIDWDIVDSLAKRTTAISLRPTKVVVRITLRLWIEDIPRTGEYLRKSLPKLCAGELLLLEFIEH